MSRGRWRCDRWWSPRHTSLLPDHDFFYRLSSPAASLLTCHRKRLMAVTTGTRSRDGGRSVQSLQMLGRQQLMRVSVLGLACVAAFCSRLFAVIRFESIIHEFDPWFNYRSTHYMVDQGFYNFLNWFDERAWYPLGRIVGGTVYPGLMLTSGLIHWVLSLLNFPVHIRDVCVFLAPVFSGLTAVSTYLLTKELWSEGGESPVRLLCPSG